MKQFLVILLVAILGSVVAHAAAAITSPSPQPKRQTMGQDVQPAIHIVQSQPIVIQGGSILMAQNANYSIQGQ